MEFEFLGDRCAVRHCRQHDYLPFKCDACRCSFCDEHKTQSAHSCKSPAATLETLLCKDCGEVIARIRSTISEAARDAAIRGHKRVCTYARSQAPICALPTCRTRLTAPISCTHCARMHCIIHRAVTKHACTSRSTTVPAPSRPTRSNRPQAPPRGYANSALDPAGDSRLEGPQRVYADVHFAGDQLRGQQSIFFFFGRKWTVARVLEVIAKEARVPLITADSRRLQMRVGGRVCDMLDRIELVVPQHSAVTVEYAIISPAACSADVAKMPHNSMIDVLVIDD